MPDFTVELDGDVTIIQIDYAPGTPDPGRVFRSMAGLIEAVHRIDRDLAHSLSATVEPQVFLERVEAGSIRAILKTLLVQVDDDALRTLDWKPLIGQYLVRGKHRLLKWLDGRSKITTRTEVLGLREELQALAPAEITGVLLPPAPISVEQLLWDIEAISRAVVELQPEDSAKFISPSEESRIETGLRITPDEIELLLTEDVVRSESELVLLVKKPDYLGNSMWEFRLGERSIEAKMLDEQWLEQFRRGDIPLQPGDALRAVLRTETARGFEGYDVATHYSIPRVLGVVRKPAEQQGTLM